eukprot:NODE_4242_length_801_cov_50.618694_g4219_i0.p1 GENE.NODE_4242_length_801_cov_50.618694_g4219_i0~~NODE_4242_length_801_cov_50.618694_g4219_i0.p1  ORF type:complete len:198 (+),score=10.70 NODE_4242_length_801_cov_50.618694_g4219_i0:83-676(+)
MTASRFDTATNQRAGAWRERILLEDRTTKMVQLQLASDRLGRPFFDPTKQNYYRFGAKSTNQPIAVTSQILPHLVSDPDRKRLLDRSKHILTQVNAARVEAADQPLTLADLPGGELPHLRPSSRQQHHHPRPASRASLASSRRSTSTTRSVDMRLERLEETLSSERQGRIEVQQQLSQLRKLMEDHFTSPVKDSSKD